MPLNKKQTKEPMLVQQPGAYPPLPEPVEILWPELHSHALGCGVEDRGLLGRYECAEYGWQEGATRAMEQVPAQLFDADMMRQYVDADRLTRPQEHAGQEGFTTKPEPVGYFRAGATPPEYGGWELCRQTDAQAEPFYSSASLRQAVENAIANQRTTADAEAPALPADIREAWDDWFRKGELYARLTGTLFELAQPGKAMWMPIDEAPKDGTEVWAFNGEQGRMLWTSSEDWSGWVWGDPLLSDADPAPDQPTHYMALPPDPEL